MCYIVLFWHTLFLIFWRLSKVINKGLWQILQLFHSQTYHTACALALTQIEARQTHTIVDTTLVSSHDISYHGDSWHIVNIYHSWFIHNFCHKLSEIRAQCTTPQKKAYIRAASSCVRAITISLLLTDCRNGTKLSLSTT